VYRITDFCCRRRFSFTEFLKEKKNITIYLYIIIIKRSSLSLSIYIRIQLYLPYILRSGQSEKYPFFYGTSPEKRKNISYCLSCLYILRKIKKISVRQEFFFRTARSFFLDVRKKNSCRTEGNFLPYGRKIPAVRKKLTQYENIATFPCLLTNIDKENYFAESKIILYKNTNTNIN
jgi:hypothetical protein